MWGFRTKQARNPYSVLSKTWMIISHNSMGKNNVNANLEKSMINFKWIYCWNISEILQEMPKYPLDETIKQLLKSDCHKI